MVFVGVAHSTEHCACALYDVICKLLHFQTMRNHLVRAREEERWKAKSDVLAMSVRRIVRRIADAKSASLTKHASRERASPPAEVKSVPLAKYPTQHAQPTAKAPGGALPEELTVPPTGPAALRAP